MSTRAIYRMPMHLFSLVLSHLDNMQSLGAAILSHPLFYAAYQDDRGRLVFRVLRNQIPDRSMPYAFILHEASTCRTDDVAQIKDFLEYKLILDFGFGPPWSLPRESNPSVAAALSKTHQLIEYFTQSFVRDTLGLARHYIALNHSHNTPISEDETFRIHRALYRFQLYCTLFFPNGDEKYVRPDSQRRRDVEDVLDWNFFGTFSPWVNEQLACIHDHLERVLSPAFDGFAQHDVHWGYKNIDWVSSGRKAEHKQTYLSLGLPFLYQLDRADRRDHHAMLLSKGNPPPSTKHMLASHFRLIDVSKDSMYVTPLETWDDRELSYLEGLNTEGLDHYKSAPYNMWYEANKSFPANRTVHNRHRYCLRHYGYVMWDANPNLDIAAMQRLLRRAVERDERYKSRDKERRKKMKRSWLHRWVIYQCRGDGQWDDGDLSRVTWRDRPPRHSRTRSEEGSPGSKTRLERRKSLSQFPGRF